MKINPPNNKKCKIYPTLSASKLEKGISVITAQRYPIFSRSVSNVYEIGAKNI